MADKISIDSLTPNSHIAVKGVVRFSRITKHLEGEALAADNARKVARGMRPIDKPYTTITIEQANVISANPNAPTLEEQYVMQNILFMSQQHPERNYQATVNNKSQNLPEVYQRDQQDVNTVTRIYPDGELANGMNVTIVLRVFKPRTPGMHNGISLDSIICDEPIRTAAFGGSAAGLTGLGLNVRPASPEDEAAYKARMDAQAAAEQAEKTPTNQPPINTSPNGYGAMPQQAYAAPNAQPNPYGNAAPIPQQNPYGNSAAAVNPNPYENPAAAGQQGNPYSGISL